MRVLSDLPKTKLAVSGGTDATVTNRGSTVAALVRVALRDAQGNRVLPAEYSDNYFWLLPGESRTVKVSWPSRLGHPKGLTVTAEAYNS